MKKILIAYASSHGTTEKAAYLVKDALKKKGRDYQFTTYNLKKRKKVDLNEYDTVIIGGSIHIGTIQRSIRKFLRKNQVVLMDKKVGLFLCCMQENETERKQLEDSYPPELREQAAAVGLFGGEFLIDKMNFLERLIVKKVSGTTKNVSNLNKEEISRFAKKMQMGA